MDMLWLFLVACRTPAPPSPVGIDPATRWVESPAGIVLEVAVDHYARPEGPEAGEVVVVGSVHVAEAAFFDVSVASLSSAGDVLYEGLIDDMGADPGEPDRVAERLGLVSQSDIDVQRPGWRHADLRQSELRRRMAEGGVGQGAIVDLLGDPAPPPPCAPFRHPPHHTHACFVLCWQ